MARILLVDDEIRLVTLLQMALAERGHEVTGVTDGQSALDLVHQETFDLVLTDLRMEPVDGMAVIEGVKQSSPETAVVVLTAYGDVQTAVQALQRGAFHFLTKPFNYDAVAHVIDQALAAASVQRENRALRHTVRRLEGEARLLGDAATTRRLRELIARVAPSEATVLIRGESGSGKEIVARDLHAASNRARGPFVAVNCAAIAESLLESELFGHRKGAFTGADRDREGLFEAAQGGTLLLDEIGEAGPGVQSKLLRVLESRRRSTCGCSRRPTVPWNRPSPREPSARISTTGCRSSPSTCRRCASGPRTCPCSSSTSWTGSAARRRPSQRRPSSACACTPGLATCGSCAT